ncbi:MAG: alpha-amylase family glycosyl hydrolase, partial [Spirochaetia bacterium]|nr:alpha-amylase family glycosyl hydrolase [Spirochaetia bacterium]
MEALHMEKEAAGRIRELLEFIYKDQAGRAEQLVLAAMERWQSSVPRNRTGAGGQGRSVQPTGGQGRGGQFSEKDVLLISYGDMIAADAEDQPGPAGQTALGRLGNFINRHAAGLFSYVHILPFCPYSSDDGFSVMDYRVVDPALGNWDDIRVLGRGRKLVFDLVLNHASAQGVWFKRFLAGEKPYDRYFITRPLDYDSRSVTRPRTHPLITPCKLDDGRIVGLWTTFSADQVDLDFSEPAVLADFVDILLEYAARG